VAEVTQPKPETVKGDTWSGWRRGGRQDADPVQLPRRLRLGGEWRGEEAKGDAGDEPSPVDHSIT
ncbi:MAG TPA: hypothetical protein VG457_17435, partial [Planctomycetota bacterium]|nr:hypothetical protein [Planctomycetota bacterium]